MIVFVLSSGNPPHQTQQQGFIAFAMMTLIIASASVAVLSTLSAGIQSHYNAKKDYDQLQQIRESLIAFATIPQTSATDPAWKWTPGKLPCPDLDHDGLSDTTVGNCSTSNNTIIGLGWLPYKTLKLPELRDSGNDHFWYQVTSAYANTSNVINHTLPNLSFSPTPPYVKDTIAVVIAPGKALDDQTSRYPLTYICSGSCIYPDKYLEGRNKDGIIETIEKRAEMDDTFNDLVIAIRPSDLWLKVEHAVLKETKKALIESKPCFDPTNPAFPKPAPASALLPAALQVDATAKFGKLPIGSSLWQGCTAISPAFKSLGWFTTSGWYNAIFYANDSNNLTWTHNSTTSSKSVLLISAGFDINPTLSRPNAVLSDYLEDENAIVDGAYKSESPIKDYTDFNDLIEIVQ
jgi:hypothetical protein